MLTSLYVKNYVLIDSLEISFPEGLIIITGQTGAGKSIILGALSLIMGATADASMIGLGEGGCVVEAEFDIGDDGVVKSLLEENNVDWNDGHLIVRRVVNVSGRSRSFINDSPVRVNLLSHISGRLIDIHSQHQTLLLTDSDFQLSLLDNFAGNQDLLAKCSAAYSEMRELKSSLVKVEKKLLELDKERVYTESLFNELEEANLQEGELEELEEEQRQLANAEQIKEMLCEAENLLVPDDSLGESISPVADTLKEVERLLERVAKYIPSIEDIPNRIESARIEINDIVNVISSTNEDVVVSGERLTIVEDRMSVLYSLLKKHSCVDIAALIDERQRLSNLLYDSTALVQKKASLEKDLEKSITQLNEVAALLSKSRQKAAKPFSETVQKSIRFLELDRAIFKVELNENPIGPSGKDAISFLFSANMTKPVDVSECASGGEMSRIMLCLKAMLAQYAKMPTMIFDEIDTGVSGSVADKMGSMICDMGRHMQVFAITHLPQVAAKGLAHYLVSKNFNPETDVAVTDIVRLSEEERIFEVARMLSGSDVSEAAIANARTLLSSNNSV